MKRIRVFIAAMAATVVVMTAVPAIAATWTSTNCNSSWYTRSTWKRADAYAYAQTAIGDGYEWGGGCWDMDGTDDTPGAPDSGGEGPDCSGYVFKTWALDNEEGASVYTFRYRYKMYMHHGPYIAAEFKSAADPKYYNVSKSSRLYMDAVATSDHVGLFVSNYNSSGVINMIEARGDAWGVGTWHRWDVDSSSIKITRRMSWTASCYPNCS